MFVAGFIGSPKMNFFAAADVNKSATKTLGRAVADTEQVGLRPEHLTESKAAGSVVSGTLELIENLGEYALVHLTTESGVSFIAKLDRPPEVKKGTMMHFTASAEQAHYFDTETGKRV